MKTYLYIIVFIFVNASLLNAVEYSSNGYEDLVLLFKEWREFERPPTLDGAPDYTVKTFDKRFESFKKYKKRLNEIDYHNWPIEHKVDWYIVFAEMSKKSAES